MLCLDHVLGGPTLPNSLRRRSSPQDYLPLTAKVPGSSPARSKITLCEKVSSYLRKDSGSTQSELFWGLPLPIKLKKSLNNPNFVDKTYITIQFNSMISLWTCFICKKNIGRCGQAGKLDWRRNIIVTALDFLTIHYDTIGSIDPSSSISSTWFGGFQLNIN